MPPREDAADSLQADTPSLDCVVKRQGWSRKNGLPVYDPGGLCYLHRYFKEQ
jgi:hypothetical protein